MKNIKIKQHSVLDDIGWSSSNIAWPGRYRISPNKRGPLYLVVRQCVGYYGVHGSNVILKIEDYSDGVPEGVHVGPAPDLQKDYDVEWWWSNDDDDDDESEHWGTEELNQLIEYLTQIRNTIGV